MRPRFHVPDFDAAAPRVALPEDEAAHLSRVLRLGPGARVEVFDGRGGAWEADVVEAGKRGASVRARRPVAPAAEPRVPVVLAAAVLKGDKMDAVVRDAVMLGVAAIQPLLTAHAEVSLAALTRGRRVDRWARVAVASAKQCGRAVVPAVREPLAFARYLEQRTETRLMCVEPGASATVVSVRDVPAAPAAGVLVGPEGGWAPEEIAAASAAGIMLVSLGARTLRADAVPLVALTALLTAWRDL